MKEKSNLQALLRKHLQGKLSAEEKLEIIYYFRKYQTFEEFPDVEEILDLMEASPELEEGRANDIFDNILKISNQVRKPAPRKKARFFLPYAAAAVFIGLIFISYQHKDFFMPTDAPNFNSEDSFIRIDIGEEIKIIDERDSLWIKDLYGNVVGQQLGNAIVYNKSDYTDQIHYNTLIVPHGKKFELSLADGTRVNLNAGTSLIYPVSFKRGEPRGVFLDGEAFFDVFEDQDHPFIVKAQELSVKVFGTSFNVAAYPEEEMLDVVLVEGKVGMYTHEFLEDDKPFMLEPGDMGSFSKSDNQLSSKKVDPEIYTGWIRGELIFRNMKFKNILKKLERRYNYTIVNKNDELGEEIFNANFGVQPVEQIMDRFEKIYGIKYLIKDRTIFIE